MDAQGGVKSWQHPMMGNGNDTGQKMWVLRDDQGRRRCAVDYAAVLQYWRVHSKDMRIDMESLTRLKNINRPQLLQ